MDLSVLVFEREENRSTRRKTLRAQERSTTTQPSNATQPTQPKVPGEKPSEHRRDQLQLNHETQLNQLNLKYPERDPQSRGEINYNSTIKRNSTNST